MSAATTTDEREELRILTERALKLTPAAREELAQSLLHSVGERERLEDENDLPHQDIDWMNEIRRRSDEIATGNFESMTREESEASIRDAISKLGVQL